jgi:uncharacterized protein YciI
MHYLLFYEVVDDYAEKRAPFRKDHLAHARAAAARGELVLAGALANPVDGTVLLFKGESPAAAEAFARADPYVTNGVVLGWRVREWTTVIGNDAQVPLPPGI